MLPDWHHHLHPLLPCLLQNLLTPQSKDRASEDIRYQSSRLLVNLTCNDDNIRPLLRARCPPGYTILALVTRTSPEEQLLRNVTFLANLAVLGPGSSYQLRSNKNSRTPKWPRWQDDCGQCHGAGPAQR